MSLEIIHEKIKQAIGILDEKDIDLWLTFIRESSTNYDPSVDMMMDLNCAWQCAFMINRNGDTTAIVGAHDLANIQAQTFFKNIIPYEQSIKQPLQEYLLKHNPKKIAINYSLNTNIADGLTHGMYLILLNYLEGTPFAERLISSEDIITTLKGRKSKAELVIMQRAVDETLLIFDEVTKILKAGLTERDVAAFILTIANQKDFELAWEPNFCPAVFTGPNNSSAHTGPTERIIEKGHLVNVDFGIKIDGYCSDLQRTWYILRDDEHAPPEEVQKGFEVLKQAARKAAAVVKPGVMGCQVDDAARNYITENGYEEYPHGLGHQVGKIVHDGGGGFFPRWERYGNTPYLPIEANQVYTIEPRLTVNGHGTITIEEEIVVTETGCYYLSKPQEELILIKDT